MTIPQLKKQYYAIVDEYIKKFSKKQGLELEFWVSNVRGGVACFGDVFFFGFDDIVYDINTRQPPNQITEWIYESIEHEDTRINYKSYCMGLRFEDVKEAT